MRHTWRFSAFLLEHNLLYLAAFWGQSAVYSAAAAGYLGRGTRLGKLPVFALPLYAVMVNIAGVVAASNVVRGRRIDVWTTDRTRPDARFLPERPPRP